MLPRIAPVLSCYPAVSYPAASDPSFFGFFFPTRAQIRRFVSAEGEQGVPIPSLRGSRSARGHRQHTKHQEHVGERQRLLLARQRRRSVQGKARKGFAGASPPGDRDPLTFWAAFQTGSSRDEDGRGRPHQRVAEQNPRERQNARRTAIGGWLMLTLTLTHPSS